MGLRLVAAAPWREMLFLCHESIDSHETDFALVSNRVKGCRGKLVAPAFWPGTVRGKDGQ